MTLALACILLGASSVLLLVAVFLLNRAWTELHQTSCELEVVRDLLDGRQAPETQPGVAVRKVATA